MTIEISMIGSQAGHVSRQTRPTGMLLHPDKPDVFLGG